MHLAMFDDERSPSTGGIAFSIPAVPVPQPRPRAVIAGKRARVHEVTSVKQSDGSRRPHAIVAFKATARHAAAEAYSGPPLDGAISLRLVFVMPRPKHMRWKSKPTPRVPHVSVKDDVDNLMKSVLDSFKSLLWNDDGQIVRAEVEKWIAAGDEQPHVYVEVLRHAD